MAQERTIPLPAIPDSIPGETLVRICALLGLPENNVRKLTLEPDGVTAELYACDKNGYKLIAGDDAVTITVHIPRGGRRVRS